MITETDNKIISFLRAFGCAKTSTLTELFFRGTYKYKYAARRLKHLCDIHYLKRERDGWSEEYIYYNGGRPKHFRHALIITDFYRELAKISEIKDFKPAKEYGDIIPDGTIGFKINGVNRLALLECEISNKTFEAEKYEKFLWNKYLPYKPEIILITDKKITIHQFRIISINTTLSNLKEQLTKVG